MHMNIYEPLGLGEQYFGLIIEIWVWEHVSNYQFVKITIFAHVVAEEVETKILFQILKIWSETSLLMCELLEKYNQKGM